MMTIGRITSSLTPSEKSENSDIATHKNGDMIPITDSLTCPTCHSKEFVKRGFKYKLREKIQLYKCVKCKKTFSEQTTKGKHYPLNIILKSISDYNLGHSAEEVANIVGSRENQMLNPETIREWVKEFKSYCPFSRMREFAIKKYSPDQMIINATLAHRQLYRFSYHRAKCRLIIEEDYKHYRFRPLQEFLELVPAECPHQYFQIGERASETPIKFSKKLMIVRAKENFANKICEFVLPSASSRKNRHSTLQEFMLGNDSVTVACEVPVYLTKDDILHMKSQLGFEVDETALKDCKQITGHIDILQIRNGQIHILDFKPKAEKERPIEQLTLYAMALSRLTGLRLFEFKCAWFDEKDYFEFYPLHVLHKPKKAAGRRKIRTIEGTYLVNKVAEKMERIRPA
ncbi:hypothetical protein A3H26_00940 [candidate division WWE3 bacterium RIFCSPLOWO2_12_FULL_36_10]|uniref:PD-(D/E)XK endonuclease-like domain-containing protein n=1 Tax=candidate division WWE3 bacterium RIFCSPLOWO2_12_FULL_36_10 TaxID=1802630 RepID=A0A1F4VGV8_UNCKA|nr:MAG: hypothetical protein A3H26_00940 [candidate division WWE3 bacterium RIFCSPLOWO2_12_FULL_36_10]